MNMDQERTGGTGIVVTAVSSGTLAKAAAANPAPTPKDFWASAWDDVKAEAAKIESEIKAEAASFVTTVESDLKAAAQQALPWVKEAVMAVAPKVMSGEEKLGTAAVEVFERVQAAALPLELGDCMALVQMFWAAAANIVALL